MSAQAVISSRHNTRMFETYLLTHILPESAAREAAFEPAVMNEPRPDQNVAEPSSEHNSKSQGRPTGLRKPGMRLSRPQDEPPPMQNDAEHRPKRPQGLRKPGMRLSGPQDSLPQDPHAVPKRPQGLRKTKLQHAGQQDRLAPDQDQDLAEHIFRAQPKPKGLRKPKPKPTFDDSSVVDEMELLLQDQYTQTILDEVSRKLKPIARKQKLKEFFKININFRPRMAWGNKEYIEENYAWKGKDKEE